jgi:Zn-dependent protease
VNDTVRLGRVAGVRVGLNWSLLAMVIVIAVGLANNRFSFEAPGYARGAYDLAGALTALGLLFGVLLHELGHAVMARRSGMHVDGITLSWMGGVTRIDGEAERPRAELLIAGIGPLVSAAFGLVIWIFRLLLETGSSRTTLAVAALGWLAGINVVLAVFNLLPAAPLDGGRVLHAIVWAITGDRWRATKAAGATGVGLGGILIGVGFVIGTQGANWLGGLFIAFVGWWLLSAARAEFSAGAMHGALDGVRMADIMRPVGAAPGWITVRAFAEGYATGRPGWVWLLENWGGGYGGALLGDSLASVPFPQWDLLRPMDVAAPITATTGAEPTDEVLTVLTRSGDKQVILVVDGGRTVGAVLPSDVTALVKMRGQGVVGPKGWSYTRG